MPEVEQILRPCPACGSEERKTSAPGIRVQVAMFLDYTKMAICRKCGCVYEYKVGDSPTAEKGVGVSVIM